jgi:hypothetical protein
MSERFQLHVSGTLEFILQIKPSACDEIRKVDPPR